MTVVIDRLTLDASDVANELGYLDPAGQPRRKKVYDMVRAGKLPEPIDITLRPVEWRWGRKQIEAYVDGAWKTAS